MECLDVAGKWCSQRPVWGLDDLQGQVVAPRLPVSAEASGFLVVRAEVNSKNGLAERGGVGEGAEAGEVEAADGDDREVSELVGAFFAFALLRDVRLFAVRAGCLGLVGHDRLAW